MKKEKRDILKQFRYFKIFEDCSTIINSDYIQLKKGDIIKIYNSQLEDLLFDMHSGILWTIGYSRPVKKTDDFELKKYPEDRPLEIMEYLRMQPNFKLREATEFRINIDSNRVAYLTPEILYRMLNDSEHSVELMSGEYENVSTYNKRTILDFDGKLKYFGKGVKMLGGGTESDNKGNSTEFNNEIDVQEGKTPKIIDKLKSGLYTAESSHLTLPFFLNEGEIIDLSRPEYAFLALNQKFMRVLARSEEITSPKKKLRIYEREQKDFLPKTKIRYYRLKDTVTITSLKQLHGKNENGLYESDVSQDIGHGFNPLRVKGHLSVVESENGRISIIKVDYTNPAIYGIVDKELRKVSKRLTKNEATLMNLQEISAKQREEEKQRAEKAAKKGKDYFRIKMMADLASTYVKEQVLTEEFKEEAYKYRTKNEKSYWDTRRILGIDYDLSWEDFYMMHLIRTQKKDNRVIDATYQQKMQEERQDLVSVLNAISKKNDNQR